LFREPSLDAAFEQTRTEHEEQHGVGHEYPCRESQHHCLDDGKDRFLRPHRRQSGDEDRHS
jgi:hypothetical protein